MVRELIQPQPLRPGDRIAVLSPSWAAPAAYPAVHEQAMRRLREVVGVEPVEFPSTRRESTAPARAHDLNAAFADPSIRAVLATIGGDDQMTVLPGLDPALPRRDPKPFVGVRRLLPGDRARHRVAQEEIITSTSSRRARATAKRMAL